MNMIEIIIDCLVIDLLICLYHSANKQEQSKKHRAKSNQLSVELEYTKT